VILVQETRVCSLGDGERLCYQDLETNGGAGYRIWHNYARKTDKGGLSSGVAIVYKAHLQVQGSRDFIPHRASGLILQVAGLGKVCIGTMHMDVCGNDGEKGMERLAAEGVEHV
jgi:hypothetical protein